MHRRSVLAVLIPSACLLARTLSASVPAARADRDSLVVSASAPGEPVAPYWNLSVGAGRANEGLRADWLEHLALCARECGFRYVRFHGLFHDDMFVFRREGGRPAYNFQYVDALFDRMLDLGVRPFVELGFFPRDISPEPTCFWWGGHGRPPADFSEWCGLVEAFVRHCLARYGAEEVRRWYFEVWNEPNLRGFWDGTQEQYFELYRTTALAVKGVDPALRVGGPATSSYHPDEPVYKRLKAKPDIVPEDFIGVECKGPWIEEFLAFCGRENLPLDFVSSHPYPTSYPMDSAGNTLEMSRPVGCTLTDIRWLKGAVARSRYPDAEIHLTEWSSSPSPRDHTHDYPQAAAYIVKVNLDCLGLVHSLSYWTFTDVFEEGGAGDSVFHGGFGLVNFQGIVKPAFHAYRLLNTLGDEVLHRSDGCVVTRRASGRSVSALLVHYPPEVVAAAPLSKGSRDVAEKTLRAGRPKDVRLEIRDLEPWALFRIETLDPEHGFALKDWQAMGSPEPPTREQEELLRQRAMSTRREAAKADRNGVLRLDLSLKPWAVVSVREAWGSE